MRHRYPLFLTVLPRMLILLGRGPAVGQDLALKSSQTETEIRPDESATTLTFTLENTGAWQHLMVVYDASTGDRFIYHNGELVASDNTSTDFQGTNELLIGRWSDGNHFDGARTERAATGRLRSRERHLLPAAAGWWGERNPEGDRHPIAG